MWREELHIRLTACKELFVSLGHFLICLLPVFEYLAGTNVCFMIATVLVLEALEIIQVGEVMWEMIVGSRTLCSMTSFLATLSK